MHEFNNGLSAAEAERLAMLIEECGEVSQAVGKILRHGFDSCHPNGGPDNRENLRRELLDIIVVLSLLEAAEDVRPPTEAEVLSSLSNRHRYCHHQGQ